MSGSALTRRTSDIPFLQANDRYQVVAVSKRGTATTTTEFRYWYANEPGWGDRLTSTTALPSVFTTDEFSEYVAGTLEFPFKELKVGSEAKIEGVLVEFIPRPAAISEATVLQDYTLGFSLRVEGHGVPDISRTVSTTTAYSVSTGTLVSPTVTYSSTAAEQAYDTWPNVRTVVLPARGLNRVRSMRVVFSDIHLCAIRRVQILGEIVPARWT